ncbi:hypothetical protein SSX86_025510 [Deinandra increscens subsp. villosa]|uniref:F-box domain, FBD domain, Leucine-rich repeat domain, L domain-like protein n=1 Tax=Deinandra increscens subsp. villosa TaxID=3103831 RepID=A0AAP0GN24_9ASTR
MKKKREGKAKRLSMDRISTLPQPILEIILSLLPTHEAARTSVLSREWRYKWTKIPKLELCHYTPRENMDVRCKNLYNIHQVLLLHHVPIHELTLYTCKDCDCFEFDQIILHLAKNHTFKKLALYGLNYTYRFDLPISIFSLHHLTDLCLYCVDLEHQPVFNGFGSLRSLVLDDVGISTKTLLHLLSNCPSLKSFNLRIGGTHFGEPCTIIELFKCLPTIEHLTTCRYVFWFWLHLGAVPRALPSLLFHLKYFCFEQMSFGDRDELPFLLVLIKYSPNLEKIKLEIDSNDKSFEEYSVEWEEYSNVWLEHLVELEIEYFSNLKLEMEFVKFILARSPKLKTVRIESVVDEDQESEMFKTLLRASRASPVIIDVT